MQRLRLAALTEDLGSVPNSSKPVTAVTGDRVPASGLLRYQAQTCCTHIYTGSHTYITKLESLFKNYFISYFCVRDMYA